MLSFVFSQFSIYLLFMVNGLSLNVFKIVPSIPPFFIYLAFPQVFLHHSLSFFYFFCLFPCFPIFQIIFKLFFISLAYFYLPLFHSPARPFVIPFARTFPLFLCFFCLSYESCCVSSIEEGLNQKTRQRSSPLIGGQKPCRASCFASIFLKQRVELNLLFQKERGRTATVAGQRGRLNSTVCFKKTEAKQLSRQGFCPPIRRHDLGLVF